MLATTAEAGAANITADWVIPRIISCEPKDDSRLMLGSAWTVHAEAAIERKRALLAEDLLPRTAKNAATSLVFRVPFRPVVAQGPPCLPQRRGSTRCQFRLLSMQVVACQHVNCCVQSPNLHTRTCDRMHLCESLPTELSSTCRLCHPRNLRVPHFNVRLRHRGTRSRLRCREQLAAGTVHFAP